MRVEGQGWIARTGDEGHAQSLSTCVAANITVRTVN